MTAEEYIYEHWVPNKVWTHLEWPKHQKRLKICAEQMKGYDFADIGCACGHSTEIMNHYKKGSWTGIDGSVTAIKKATEWFPDKSFHYVDGFNYRGAIGRKFDSVVCSEVIEHIKNEKALLMGLLNVANFNIVITTPNKKVSDPGHCKVYDHDSILKLLNDCNVKKFKIRSIDTFWYIVIDNE